MLTSIKKYFTIGDLSQQDFWLWPPIFFAFGVVFYLCFSEAFAAEFFKIAALFFSAAILAFLNRKSLRFLVFVACSFFLAGSFYGFYYDKFFNNYTKITGKIYVDVLGKVDSLRYFANPVNGNNGANITLINPQIFKADFSTIKKENFKKIKKKVKKKIKKKKVKKKTKKKTKKKSSKPKLDKLEDEEKLGKVKLKKSHKKSKKKVKKKRKISTKKIEKDYLNLAEYQEIDRKFLERKKNYQQVDWFKINGREVLPNAPPKISLNLVKNYSVVAINDVIAVKALLEPPKGKEFPDDFDFKNDAIFKKIGSYGFVIGEAKVLKKAKIENLQEWFLSLRDKINLKISAHLDGDEAAIAKAFLIGDQNEISAKLMAKIRISGLAHLLSISGFHLSLVASIFFILVRFLLSRSEFLALNFDLKKFAAIAAVISSYFYLQIAASPIPAQRAFLAVLFVSAAIYANQKINQKRAIIFAAFLLILLNPRTIFSLSFQLSFVAVLALSGFILKAQKVYQRKYFLRTLFYLRQIIFASFVIQIATAPFLIKSFGNFSTYGFLANVLAVPLATFWIMPCGFLALFLMFFGAEGYPLILMAKGISLIEKIAVLSADFDYANFANLKIFEPAFLLAVISFLLICLAKNLFRKIGFICFLLSFFGVFWVKKPQIAFAKKQDFFVIYNEEEGPIFSKELRPSKRREAWVNWFGGDEFKSLKQYPNQKIICDDYNCKITHPQKILVLLKRNKTAEICKNDFSIIVNLTSKYELPSCISENKIIIDNRDFYENGGYFFYEKDREILVKNAAGKTFLVKK